MRRRARHGEFGRSFQDTNPTNRSTRRDDMLRKAGHILLYGSISTKTWLS